MTARYGARPPPAPRATPPRRRRRGWRPAGWRGWPPAARPDTPRTGPVSARTRRAGLGRRGRRRRAVGRPPAPGPPPAPPPPLPLLRRPWRERGPVSGPPPPSRLRQPRPRAPRAPRVLNALPPRRPPVPRAPAAAASVGLRAAPSRTARPQPRRSPSPRPSHPTACPAALPLAPPRAPSAQTCLLLHCPLKQGRAAASARVLQGRGAGIRVRGRCMSPPDPTWRRRGSTLGASRAGGAAGGESALVAARGGVGRMRLRAARPGEAGPRGKQPAGDWERFVVSHLSG